MEDNAGNAGPNVNIRCLVCDVSRNMMEAAGARGERNLPRCRGRHPHLSRFDAKGCAEQARLLIVGASNQWFATTLSVLAIPPSGADELRAEVARHWATLSSATAAATGLAEWSTMPPSFAPCGAATSTKSWLRSRPTARNSTAGRRRPPADLRTPEWNAFTAAAPPTRTTDFALRRPGVDASLQPLLADVVQAERLRMVRAFTGFTRLDAPDPVDPAASRPAPISRERPDLGAGQRSARRRNLPAAAGEPGGTWEDQVITSRADPATARRLPAISREPQPRAQPGLRPQQGLARAKVHGAAYPVAPAHPAHRHGMRLQFGEPGRAHLHRH